MAKIMRQTSIKKFTASLLISSMLLSFGACSQNSKYSLDKIKLSGTERSWACPDEKYKTLLESYDGYTVTGAIAVATDKDIVYLYAEDALEKDGKTKVSQDTVFDIASVSKVFTAVAILQLQEKGKLSLDDTLDKYFPEYETGKKITIYNLLHMNSGIPDYLNNPDPFWNISGEDAANKQISDILLDKTTDEQLLKAMYKAPLDFEPGTEYGYSNTNYRLLAFIIEKLSGMKLSDYLKKNIFDKCGMKKTTSMATGDMTYVPADFAELVQYGFSDKDGYPACPNNSRGDGGIHSCLTDMVAFDRALFGGKLLSQKSMEILLKDENGYCCGLTKNKNGYSHDGSSMTCIANNKITESEEFGHVYVISLERTGVMPQMSGDDPLSGTRYTKGTFSDGVYVNEYAKIKLNVPKANTPLTEAELLQMMNSYLSDARDKKDKTILSATRYDASFWDGTNSISIEIQFLNTKLGVPGDPDFTEDEWLDFIVGFNGAGLEKMGGTQNEKERSKVKLGGQEYTRAMLVIDYYGEMHGYHYARKLDDNLMCIINISMPIDKNIADYEKMFE